LGESVAFSAVLDFVGAGASMGSGSGSAMDPMR
jgi:hypothetical protein